MAMKEATLPRSFAYGRKIYTPEDSEIPEGLYDELVEQGVLQEDGEPTAQERSDGLFEGLSDEQVASLEEAGYADAESISAATVSDLKALDHIGDTTVKKLKERAG